MRIARFHTFAVMALGFTLLAVELPRWESPDLVNYGCFLLLALISANLRIDLPLLPDGFPVGLVFSLIAVVQFSLPETLLLGCSVALIQGLWDMRHHGPRLKVVFRATAAALALTITHVIYHSNVLRAGLFPKYHSTTGDVPLIETILMVVIASLSYFVAHSVPLAADSALGTEKTFRRIWREEYIWTVPYYLLSAGLALATLYVDRNLGWETALLVVPVFYLIYRAYGFYLARLETERQHAQEMATLHLRTIEALALAIEAKDHTTHDHLQRVQVYAMELGKDLGLNREELEALRAAALLHDIGKLAVPEHIISKPGRLTPEEFEKMKIHPLVGAEILEHVKFPYPVVPIVRAHHEKWDGSGYPYGLAGNSIPIGARILAAVDALDALASHRQYRRALPLDEAMQKISEDSGRGFDPRVVAVLQQRYVELERMAQAKGSGLGKLSTEVKITNGLAPAAGFEVAAPTIPGKAAEDRVDFLESIASARQEVLALFELSQDLGNSLSLDETLSVLAVRLRRLIPHHAMAVYMKRDDRLIPEYVTGDDFRLFSSLEIPIGQGLSGWVAENRKPIMNGNPTVEPGYLNDPNKFSTLRSAIAVPLEGLNGVVGVMTLYHAERDAFTKDNLRILLAVSSKVALCTENALKYLQAEKSATIDYLTGLPNARSLFLHLDQEMTRCQRMNVPLTVVVCDLDDFKLVNDRFGHLEGNKVLRLVGRGLKDGCTDFDYVARMGGDEFVIVMPGITPDSIGARIERFRAAVAGASQEMQKDELLSFSMGAAHLPEDGSDAEQLLAEADRRMYKEKQVHKYSLPTETPGWSFDLHSTTIQ